VELDAPGVNVAFDPAAGLLAVAGDDGVTTLWDLSTFEVVGELRHGSGLLDLAWSRDGRFILTAAGDGAHLWDVATQQRIRSFTQDGGAPAVEFTSDDGIVIGSADGTVFVDTCGVCGGLEGLLADAQRSNVRALTTIERDRFLRDLAG
jgi:WD40 repeat protein